MTSAGRPIDVLLVEDDPGDELITREAFEHNKIKNNLHVAHDGEEGLDFLYRRGELQQYMDLLVRNFNPAAVGGVMCTDTISVRWYCIHCLSVP